MATIAAATLIINFLQAVNPFNTALNSIMFHHVINTSTVFHTCSHNYYYSISEF